MRRLQDHAVSAFILHSPAEFAHSAGVDVDRVLRRHDIAPDSLHTFGARIPAIAAMEAWTEMARRSGDPDYGLHLVEQESLGAYDVLGYIVRGSHDLEHGIGQLIRYQRLLGDAWRISFRTDGTSAILTHDFLVPVHEPRHLVEHDLGLVARRIREFTCDDWSALEVGFRHAAPASLALHERIFGCTVRYRQLADSLRFDRAMLAWPLNETDSRLARVLERYAAEALRRLPPLGEFGGRVRARIAGMLGSGEFSAAAIARKLHTSPRTLQRRLAEEHTSLRQLLDAVRRELAEVYLAKQWMSLEEIALLLGFSETSGFTHVFRRWTGRAPTEYRRELRSARAGRSHTG